MTIYGSDGKTTYSDGDSLSGDLGRKVRDGDKDALQKLKEFATNKDPKQPHSQARALYELAEVYFNGFCEVNKSLEEALKFLIQAAELNDDLAAIRLGEIYRDGKYGFKQDGQKALELFLKVAELNDHNGYKLAAEMFREGKGVKADGYKAIEFYEKLDALDDNQAVMNIAQIYEEGCGRLRANGYKALEIYDDIIRQSKYWIKVHRDFGIESSKFENYKRALRHTAQIYLEGKAGVAPDGCKAVEYFSKEIEYDTEVLNKIAEIYRDGKGGVEPDGYKAIEYLTEIIRRNDTDNFLATPINAMKMIADIWREGKAGVTQDGPKAVEYFIKLTESNDSSGLILCEPDDAFYELGKIYEEGCGEIVPDLQRAIDFYQKSAALENYFAKMKLKELVASDNDE